MKKYLFIVLLVGVCFGNQRYSRTPIDVIQLHQSDLRTNNFRNEEELLNFIQSTMDANYIPGLSISIAKGGSIVWNKHFGYANINENILVDENTKFILSSASKTITATALMHLSQQNLFMLDDDVDNYLPFDISHPDHPEIPITFKMLLSHTSGIKDNWSFMPYYDGDSPLELSYYLSQYFSPSGEFYDSNLNFTDYAPGTGFSYSNIGAALVGLLVEEISNQSFNEYCIENIFEPLGMSDAYWFLSEIENLNEVALPHQFADGSTDSLIVLENYGYSDYPAGQLRTTSYNLAKFMNLFINDGMFDDVEILSPETIELMKTIHYPNVAYDQGLMWYYKTLNEKTLFGHGGSDKGSLTEMFISFSDTVGVILLSNSRNHEGMAQIENAVFNYAVETDFTTGLDFECIAEDGTEGMEVWGQCYSIENTTSLGWPPFVPDTATVLPEDLFDLINLTSLSINYTNVGGIIPPEIGNLTNLIKLNLSSNQFTGIIPSEIGNLTNLTSLNLSSNQFSGDMPIEIFNLSNLEGGIEPALMGTVFYPGLDLSNNLITGTISEEIGNLTNLKSLDFSSNQLEGNLPISLYSLDSLQSLNLSNNLLTGEISEQIGNLLSLEGITTYAHNSVTQYDALNLSNNLMTGIIPSEICNLPLDWGDSYMNEYQGFSISNNQFCSPYPQCMVGFIGSQDTINCVQMYNQNFEIAPIKYSIFQNYPNPFNPITSLRYDLPNDGLVNITIYDMMGRVVKTLVNSSQTGGYKSVQWNATNDRNEPVSAGLYLYTIQAGEFRQTKKMVLLK